MPIQMPNYDHLSLALYLQDKGACEWAVQWVLDNQYDAKTAWLVVHDQHPGWRPWFLNNVLDTNPEYLALAEWLDRNQFKLGLVRHAKFIALKDHYTPLIEATYMPSNFEERNRLWREQDEALSAIGKRYHTVNQRLIKRYLAAIDRLIVWVEGNDDEQLED